jgi:hypothetical protein
MCHITQPSPSQRVLKQAGEKSAIKKGASCDAPLMMSGEATLFLNAGDNACTRKECD